MNRWSRVHPCVIDEAETPSLNEGGGGAGFGGGDSAAVVTESLTEGLLLG
jgi:hypothetical protein